jgi:hypothetical protein
MEYHKIISVTGLGGLYELVGSKTDGAIVRSLEDKSTKFVASRVHNFSHLESIEIFTERDNANLVDVLQAMEKSTEKLPDEKDAAAVKKYFEKVYPEMDFERVYASDTKKMVRWFKILKENNVEIKLREAESEAEETAEPETKVEEASEKKQSAKVKKEKAENEKAEEATAETKPKKTAVKKEKEESSEAAPAKKAAKKKKED